MTFKEFSRWCNQRACDGMWGSKEAIQCLEIGTVIRQKVPFWKREKVWKDYCSQTEIVEIIIEPTNRLIEKYLSETETV